MKKILYIATLISIVTYLFWSKLPKGTFYLGNSLFVMFLCLYLYLNDKKSFIKFFLLSISVNNFLDEILFDPTVLDFNELLLLVVIPIFWIFKIKRNARQI